MNKYRKIWESINGPIPKDQNGKSYEIHHIDGDRTNNHISNLRLVTMQEHYEIHYNQGDYGACQAIAMRMNLMVDDLSEKCSKLAKLRVLNGTHNLTGDRNPIHDRVQDGTHRKWLSERNVELFKQGKHNFQKRPDGTSVSSDKVKNGTHNFTYEFCKESWLKSAEIQYLKPARKDLHYSIKIDDEMIKEVEHAITSEGKFVKTYTIEIYDTTNNL